MRALRLIVSLAAKTWLAAGLLLAVVGGAAWVQGYRAPIESAWYWRRYAQSHRMNFADEVILTVTSARGGLAARLKSERADYHTRDPDTTTGPGAWGAYDARGAWYRLSPATAYPWHAATPPTADWQRRLGLQADEILRATGPNSRPEVRSKTWIIVFPPWLLLLPLATYVATRAVLFLRRAQRHAAGHCPTCGYDLRATTERCPECGAPVPTSALSAPSASAAPGAR